MSVLATALLICSSRLSEIRLVLAQANRPFLLLIGLATASTLWSANTSSTLGHLFRLTLFNLVALTLCVNHWNPQRLQQTLRPFLFGFLIASTIFLLMKPDLANPSVELAGVLGWRGLALHKNVMGALAALSLLVWMHALLTKEKSAVIAIPAVLLSFVWLAGSKSSTSMLNGVFSCAILILILKPPSRQFRRVTPLIVGGLAVCIALYALAVLNVLPGSNVLLAPIATITGKDMTFTGRAAIWEIIREEITHHPWLGIGYGGYWTGATPSSPSYVMVQKLYFYPSEAHNGFLEIINELGYVGCLLLISFLYVYGRQAVSLLRTDKSTAALHLTLLFQALLGNLSEAHFMQIGGLIGWLVMTGATFNLARFRIHETEMRKTYYRREPDIFETEPVITLPAPRRPFA